jgi:hypothetical protein
MSRGFEILETRLLDEENQNHRQKEEWLCLQIKLCFGNNFKRVSLY